MGHVHQRTEGAVVTLTFDRPEKKNALTDAMYAALVEGLEAAAAASDIHVVVITGAGGVFTAGNDLADFVAAVRQPPPPGGRHVHRLLHLLARYEKPLVAAVPGLAVGIGTTLLLHCDYVILADDAVLQTPFAKLGLVPEAGSSLLLPALIGHQRAFAMLALGERVPAASALAWGLANSVVPAAELSEAAARVAQTLAAQPQGALRETKRLMRDRDAIIARIEDELLAFEDRLRSPEAQAAFEAFFRARSGG